MRKIIKGRLKTFENLIDKTDLQSLLPNIGDILFKVPTIDVWLTTDNHAPQECTVVYVNREHLWYEVEFDAQGHKFKECYSVIPGERTYDFYTGSKHDYFTYSEKF